MEVTFSVASLIPIRSSVEIFCGGSTNVQKSSDIWRRKV
jgi:hypothetical protein